MTTAAARIRTEVDDAWRSLRAAAMRCHERAASGATAAGWSLNEMLAHVAFWEEAASPVVTNMLRGLPMPEAFEFGSGYVLATDRDWPSFEEHNAREAEWGHGQPIEAILARLDRAHVGLLGVLETVTDDEATTHAVYYQELADHLREHTSELARHQHDARKT